MMRAATCRLYNATGNERPSRPVGDQRLSNRLRMHRTSWSWARSRMMSDASDQQIAEWKEQFEGDVESLMRLIITYRKPVQESDVRVSSVILRKWLVGGLLGQLCRALGAKPTFPVFDNAAVIAAIPHRPQVRFFLTGGVCFDGRPIYGVYKSDAPRGREPDLPVLAMDQELIRTSDFLSQKRVFFEGDYFSTQEIIQFVANKLGGAHLDSDWNVRHQRLARAADFMTFGGPADKIKRGRAGELHMLVEPDSTEALSGLHVEIIAAAASLIGVHLNGEQLVPLEVKPNWKAQLRQRVFGPRPPRLLTHEF